MNFFVLFTFDLTTPMSHNYREIEAKLADIGLMKALISDEIIRLPNNTYAGVLQGDSVQQVMERVRDVVKTASSLGQLDGSGFISVSPAADYQSFTFNCSRLDNVKSARVDSGLNA